MHPSTDAWGAPLTGHRAAMASKPYFGGYRAIFDGVQADRDFLRVIFGLEQHAGKQKCCYYCSALQWVRADLPPSGPNNPDLLYTTWGREAAYRHTCPC